MTASFFMIFRFVLMPIIYIKVYIHKKNKNRKNSTNVERRNVRAVIIYNIVKIKEEHDIN